MSPAAPAADTFRVTLPARPYPGLRPFNQDEWPIFFGRERMIDEVVDRLIPQRLLVVHGDSGSGKSSLIRAGVLPRLEQDSARNGTRWVTGIATPGDQPLANLADALAGLSDDDDDDDLERRRLSVRRALNCGREGAAGIADLLRGHDDRYACLLIDQFEEVFAHARRRGPQQASLLVGLLIGLQQLRAPRLFVVLTMRSEFLGACAQFEGFAETVNTTQYLLPRMEHTDLTRAIREPATLYNGEIAPDLADKLIAEARGSQDQLPLIQHGLMRLHQRHATGVDGAWRLTLDHYRAPGGLAQLLSDHANEVMETVEPPGAGGPATRVTEDILRALTDINADGQATRHPQRLKDLMAIAGADQPTVQRIVDGFRADGVSFLRPYGAQTIDLDDYVDISHEALIRCWHKLAEPIDGWLIREFKNGLVWRSLLVQAESFERDPSNVLSPATAEERRHWLARRNAAWSERYGGGWPRVVSLIDASMAERERQLREELDARSREERAKALEEQGRLREHTLRSDLAAALEKSRRVQVFRVAFVVSLLLLSMTAYSWYRARREGDAALRAKTQAEVRLAENNLTAAYQRERAARNEATATRLEQELAGLKLAAAAAPANSAIRERIDQAGSTIAQEVTALNAAARLAPRIYVHIADEAQRTVARELERRIEGSRIGDTAIIVPGIERVDKAPPRSLLRCFVADECRQYGPQLVALVNAQLASPKLVLQDFSKTYTPDGAIRPQHFEIYFAPGAITLAAAATAY